MPAFAQPAEDAQEKLQGAWTATKAERDGKAAEDVVGHRLSFTGDRFRIRSKDGKPLYEGTVRVDPSAKPAAIDFEHTEGALKGKAWKGIYALDGDTLTIVRQRTGPGQGPARRVRGEGAGPGISSSRSSARSPEPNRLSRARRGRASGPPADPCSRRRISARSSVVAPGRSGRCAPCSSGRARRGASLSRPPSTLGTLD